MTEPESEPIRTLVVEDSSDDRALLEFILEARGHDVLAVETAEEGLAAFEDDPHCLVLLDMILPESNGIEICRKIRAMPDAADTVVFFITGVDDSGALNEALEAGANDYLLKPINSDQIGVRLTIAERQVRAAQERARLAASAAQDPLTGLPSSAQLERRLTSAIKRLKREGSDYLFAVEVVNVDHFRDVNNRHGRGVSDQLLKQVAVRLDECIRASDMVARSHGDEFVIFLDGLNDLSDPSRVANRVTEAFSTPFLVGDAEIRLSASVGMALSLSGYAKPEDAIADATDALQKAKAQGPGSRLMFDPVMQARAMARVQMEARIREAIDKKYMELWYQPFVDPATGRVKGFEALSRMRDPDRGVVSPGEFIPVAEESGLIAPIGWWTLDQAARQLEAWQKRFDLDEPLHVGVNVSGRQFGAGGVYDQVKERLNEVDLAPQTLHLEITETALMTNVEQARETLARLKEMSVKLHVDDFGTGYSSLNYLCRFPIDALKIDRSFIVRMSNSDEDLEVVRTIVRLAETLGIGVIAEGVETEEQVNHICQMGIETVQGFHFHRPMRADEAEALLEENLVVG